MINWQQAMGPLNKELGTTIFAITEFAIEVPVNVTCERPLMRADHVRLHRNIKDHVAHLLGEEASDTGVSNCEKT